MTATDFRIADVMRLLVETLGDGSSGAANNLVRNPDGATGVWWWTRDSGTLLTTGDPGITFGRGTQNTFACQTGYMPVTGETWVSARVDITQITDVITGPSAVFEFSDATHAVLGTASQSGDLTTGTQFMGSAQAPAGTSYVRILFSATSTKATASVTITNVMLTAAATDDFTTTRHNLMPNPSFEVDTSGWAVGSGTTSIARVQATGITGPVGGYMLEIVTTIQSGRSYVNGPSMPVSPLRPYAFQVWAGGGPDTPGVLVRFFNGAGTTLAEIDHPGVTSGVDTAPAGATRMQIYPYLSISPRGQSGSAWHIDKVMIEQSSTTASYFDGSTAAADNWVYSWDGTVGKSTSTATLSTDGYDYVSPATAWTDILGTANQITATRATLDTSTLTATILDPGLDPSVDPSDLLRRGRYIQLQATSDDGDTWEPIYTGTILNTAVTYEPATNDPTTLKPRISLTALDAASDLAALPSPACYSTVAALPQAIDAPGNAHPWNCNGDTGISTVVAPVSVDTQNKMSVLDQLATTRDTVSGVAFIDRRGVVNAWDGDTFVSPVSDTYSDQPINLARHPLLTSASYFGVANNATVALDPSGSGARVTTTNSGQSDSGVAIHPALPPVPAPGTYTYAATVTAVTDCNVKISVQSSTIGGKTSAPVALAAGATTVLSVTVTHTGTGTPRVYVLRSKVEAAEFVVDRVMMTADDAPPPSYSDLQVGYDESSIVNAVRVVVNSLDATGATVSTYWPSGGTVDPGTAGPISSYYVDQGSIDTHGLATATYTINMAAPTEATVQAYANDVLAANSQPRRIVTSMTVPVLDAESIARATLTDLCSVIGIQHSDLTSANHRVQTIQHTITARIGQPDQWLVTYGFAAPEALAAPQITPPAAGTVVAGGRGGWKPIPYAAGWSSYAAGGWMPGRYQATDNELLIVGTLTYNAAIAANASVTIATLPPEARPTYNVGGDARSVNIPCAVNLLANGQLQITPSAATAAGTTFALNLIFPRN